MTQYAKYTKVPQTQTVGEIRKMLKRYGADSFGVIEDGETAAIGFKVTVGKGVRMIRMRIHQPDSDEEGQGYRQVWRALLLVVKAKLESVENGIETGETPKLLTL